MMEVDEQVGETAVNGLDNHSDEQGISDFSSEVSKAESLKQIAKSSNDVDAPDAIKVVDVGEALAAKCPQLHISVDNDDESHATKASSSGDTQCNEIRSEHANSNTSLPESASCDAAKEPNSRTCDNSVVDKLGDANQAQSGIVTTEFKQNGDGDGAAADQSAETLSRSSQSESEPPEMTKKSEANAEPNNTVNGKGKQGDDLVIVEEDAVRLETGAIAELHLDGGFTISVQQPGSDSSSPENSRPTTPAVENPIETVIENSPQETQTVEVQNAPTPVATIAVQQAPATVLKQQVYGGPSVQGQPRFVSNYIPVQNPYASQEPRYVLFSQPVIQPRSSMDRIKHMMGIQQSVRVQNSPMTQPFISQIAPAQRFIQPVSQQAPIVLSQRVQLPNVQAASLPQATVRPAVSKAPVKIQPPRAHTLAEVAQDENLPPTLVKITTCIPRLSDTRLLPVVHLPKDVLRSLKLKAGAQKVEDRDDTPKKENSNQSKSDSIEMDDGDEELKEKSTESGDVSSKDVDMDTSQGNSEKDDCKETGATQDLLSPVEKAEKVLEKGDEEMDNSTQKGDDVSSVQNVKPNENTEDDESVQTEDISDKNVKPEEGENVKPGEATENVEEDKNVNLDESKEDSNETEDSERDEDAVEESKKDKNDEDAVEESKKDKNDEKNNVEDIFDDGQDDAANGCLDLRPIPKFLYKLGLDLVQQHTYFNMTKMLLKRAERGKLESKGYNHLTIIQKALEKKRLRNEAFNKLNRHECPTCDFVSESENVVMHHTEEPHRLLNRTKLDCALCDFTTNLNDVFVFHMESQHGKQGRVPRELASHQCPLCTFECVGSKNKLTKHSFKCVKMFNLERNLDPYPLQLHATLCTIPSKVAIKQLDKAANRKGTAPAVQNVANPNVQLLQLPNGGYAIQPTGSTVREMISSQLQGNYVYQPTSNPQQRVTKNNPPQTQPSQAPAQQLTPIGTFVMCEFCEGLVRTKRALQIHLKMAHGINLGLDYLEKEPKFQCMYCNKKFYTHLACNKHQKSHLTPKVTPRRAPTATPPVVSKFEKCHICGHYSSSKAAHIILNHKPSLHHMMTAQKCMFCCDRVTSMDMLESHLLSVHCILSNTLGVHNACFMCGLVFKYHYQLVSHLEKAHLVLCEEKCPECNNVMSATALSAHLISSHRFLFTNLMRFFSNSCCSICKNPLANNVVGVAKHLIEHHGLFFINDMLLARSDIANPTPIGKTESKGSHICRFCKKAFATREVLTQHYADEHVFTCKVCNTKFGSTEWLKSHYINVHKIGSDSVDKMFFNNDLATANQITSCTQCKAKFQVKNQIKHMRATHTKKCSVVIQQLTKKQLTRFLPLADVERFTRKRESDDDVIVIEDEPPRKRLR